MFPGTRRVTPWPRPDSCSPSRRARAASSPARWSSSPAPRSAKYVRRGVTCGAPRRRCRRRRTRSAARRSSVSASWPPSTPAPCSPRCRGRTSAPPGEWQAEWDALPLTCAAAAGALAGARRVVAGLSVFPERMRANLDGEGGAIMAEAAMMAVADAVGRAEAHALVSAGVVDRAERGTLTAGGARADARSRDSRRPAPARRRARSRLLPRRDRCDRERRDRWVGAGYRPGRSGGWKSSTVMPSGSRR